MLPFMKHVTGAIVVSKAAGIREYLQETLGIEVSPARWSHSRRLPLFLRDGYAYFEITILAQPFLLMYDEGHAPRSPATVRKHMAQVRTKWDGDIIYVRRQLAAYERKRLIEQSIPFVIPGNQMYLPMLGIDLREHFRKRHQTAPTLSPAAQLVVLYLLLRAAEEVHTPAELADRLGYTKMSMSRAFNELEAEELGDLFRRGRKRCLTLGMPRRDLWEKALPLLRSPVKQRHRISAQPDAKSSQGEMAWLIAGLSALANYSMLANPQTPVVATTPKRWKVLRNRFGWQPAAAGDPDALEIETWSYDPKLLSTGKSVDRLSLYLSLKDDDDERVQGSLDEMMGDVPW
jgi:DNA-binding MarR family transcriptional regulator